MQCGVLDAVKGMWCTREVKGMRCHRWAAIYVARSMWCTLATLTDRTGTWTHPARVRDWRARGHDDDDDDDFGDDGGRHCSTAASGPPIILIKGTPRPVAGGRGLAVGPL